MDDFATSEGDVDDSAPGGTAGSNARPSAPIGGRRRPMAPPEFGGGVGLKGGKPSPARGPAAGATYGSMGLELEDEEDEREVTRQMGEMRAQRHRVRVRPLILLIIYCKINNYSYMIMNDTPTPNCLYNTRSSTYNFKY